MWVFVLPFSILKNVEISNRQRRIRHRLLALALPLFVFLLGVPAAFAQDQVTFVVPIPASGLPSGANTITAVQGGGILYVYIGIILVWFAGSAGVCLLCGIVYYGFVLMFSGVSEAEAEGAKGGLMACCGGVVVLCCAGLYLYTLNPSFYSGFGSQTGGEVLGQDGQITYTPPGQEPAAGGGTTPAPPAPTPEPGPTPAVASGDVVPLCEPLGLQARGTTQERVKDRPVVVPENVQKRKQQFQSEIATALAQPGIAPAITADVVAAIMLQENENANLRLHNEYDARGLMQVIPTPAREHHCVFGSNDDLYDKQTNINCGTKLLSDYYKVVAAAPYRRSDTLRQTIAAYNGGPGSVAVSGDCGGTDACSQAVAKWECLWDDAQHTVPNTGYTETRTYVMAVSRGLGICPGDTASVCR